MSPRNEEQNALIKDDRREQILSAALHLFASRGFAATKISDIVARGGMSQGLVYHYFNSKEEIFYALLERAMDTSSQSLLMVEKMPLSPLEKVRQTARYILNGIENFNDSAYYFLIVVHASIMESEDDRREKLLSKGNIAIQTMAGFIREGQTAGEIKEGDPLKMTITFFAAIQGLAVYKLSMKNFKMPDPEIIVNMIKK